MSSLASPIASSSAQSPWDRLAALKVALVEDEQFEEDEQSELDDYSDDDQDDSWSTSSMSPKPSSHHTLQSSAYPLSLRSSLDVPSSSLDHSRLSITSWGSTDSAISDNDRLCHPSIYSRSSSSARPKGCLRRSSCKALHQELVLAARLLQVDVSLQAATSTFAHCLPDNFALNQPLPRSRASTADDDFAPRPLPYPRRQSSRFSLASSTGDDSTSERGSSIGDTGKLYNAPGSTSLRDLLRRQSLDPSSRASSLSCPHATLATTPYTSFPSSVASRRGTTFGDVEKHTLAYVSLLPSSNPSPPIDSLLPTLNRADWNEEIGLSPRSGPSPLADDVAHFEDTLDVPEAVVDIELGSSSKPSDDSMESAKSRVQRFTSEALPPKLSPSHRCRSASDSSLNSVLCFPLPPLRSALQLDLLPDFAPDGEVIDLGSPAILDLDSPEDDGAPVVGNPEPVPALPTSPSLLEVIEENRRTLGWDNADHNLCPSTPLAEAAASNGIISPNSRLLKPSRSQSLLAPASRSLGYDSLESNGDGWIGSESEEEEFVHGIRSYTLRKLGDSRVRGRPLFMHRPASSFSLVPGLVTDYRTSEPSGAASSDSAGPLTPDERDTIDIHLVDNQSDRGKSSFVSRLGRSLVSSRTHSFLPRPTRKVEGWGRPEVLIDEDWEDVRGPWASGFDSDEGDDETIEKSQNGTLREHSEAGKATPLGFVDPGRGVGLGIDYGSLLDECPPV